MELLALGAEPEKVREEVLKTTLEHHLVSNYTSLVAVDSVVSRPKETKEMPAVVKTHIPPGVAGNGSLWRWGADGNPGQPAHIDGCCPISDGWLHQLRQEKRWLNHGK